MKRRKIAIILVILALTLITSIVGNGISASASDLAVGNNITGNQSNSIIPKPPISDWGFWVFFPQPHNFSSNYSMPLVLPIEQWSYIWIPAPMPPMTNKP